MSDASCQGIDMGKMTIKPLGKTVFVKIDEAEDRKSAGGLILTVDHDRMHMDTGVVESLGPLAFINQEGITVKPGDRIVFNRYAGREIKDDVGEVTHRIISDTEIWGQIEERK